MLERVLVTDTLPQALWLPDAEAEVLRVPLSVGLRVTLPVLQLETETVRETVTDGLELMDGDGLEDTVRVLDTVLHTVGLVVAEEEEEREGEIVPVMEELPLPQELTLAELL